MSEWPEIERRRDPWGPAVFGRLDRIEQRLSRIEGGLALGGFLIITGITLAGVLHVFG